MKKPALLIGLALFLLVSIVVFGCAPEPAPPAEKSPAEKPPAEKPPAEKPPAEKPPAEKPALPEEISFRVTYAYSLTEDNACHRWVKTFRELNEKAFPEVKWDIKEYPASSLYTILDGAKACLKGSVEVAYIPDGYMVPLLGETAGPFHVSNVPFLFKNLDHFYDFWYKAEPMWSEEITEPRGVYMQGLWCSYGTNICTLEPVKTFADLQGKKIRVSPAPFLVEQIKAAGMSPMSMAWVEVAGAVQTGVVDGFTTVTTVIWRDKLNRIAPCMTTQNIPGFSSAGTYWWNKAWYDTLPKVITEKWEKEFIPAANKEVEMKVQRPLLNNWEELFTKDGAIITAWSPEDIEKYHVAVQPVIDKWSKVIGEKWINMAEEMGKKYE